MRKRVMGEDTDCALVENEANLAGWPVRVGLQAAWRGDDFGLDVGGADNTVDEVDAGDASASLTGARMARLPD